jgi:dihydropteroate synthase
LKPSAIFPRERVTIVGVLNATPDSFSDGGVLMRASDVVDVDRALARAIALVAAGADVLDVGGESTRPGAGEVPVSLEIARTRPLIEALTKRLEVAISIDTRKPEVAEAALAAGATLVNDVSGLRFDPTLARVVASAQAGLIVGHLRGVPATMQDDPRYDDVLVEVGDALEASVALALAAGIPRERLAIDPGIGFGKRLEDNLTLLARPGVLRDRLGLPVLVGPSRKGFLGTLTGEPVDRRDGVTAATCAVAVFAGADAVRVHDVEGARHATTVARALRDVLQEATA